ncbi:MAG: hypothetical protein E7568_02520 [Ruminococcaceae bacterium]|nr:hypothetical protein [Oscillospiraceae bacterium]
MENFAQRALNEYNTITIRPGGVNAQPFWNANASQFTFAPAFHFPTYPNGCISEFLFTAIDKNGNEHTFRAKKPTADLTPIWSEIPTGLVTLKVEALINGKIMWLVGTRTFFKTSPFPGRENLPKRARSYKDAALLAYKFVFEQEMTQHWLKFGTPDPEFPHNVYPAKTFSSIITGMIAYAKLSPNNADNALKIAKNAADYMISITYGKGSALKGIPPTYLFDGLNEEKVNKIAPAAKNYKDTVMTIYPASAGSAYLNLYNETKEEKYFDAAMDIANYYKDNVLDNGTWYLLTSAETGLPIKNNYCNHLGILKFLTEVKNKTNDSVWENLANNYFIHLKKTCLDQYNWEGQFEDTPVTSNYTNLTHIGASSMVPYLAKNKPEMLEDAKELMRFIEDQFVVWGEFAPWTKASCPDVKSPAGLEQYFCYWPIDGSTSVIINAFLSMYEATNDKLYFEKAAALGDMLTRMQHSDSGAIPTFWTTKANTEDLYNFWINCHIGSAYHLYHLAEITGEI